MSRTRAADDYDAIGARMRDLEAERFPLPLEYEDAVLAGRGREWLMRHTVKPFDPVVGK